MPQRPHSHDHKSHQRASTRGLVLRYALVAAAWIVLSDLLLAKISFGPQNQLLVSILKGGLFVAVTSLLLLLLLTRQQKAAAHRAARQVATTTALLEHFREFSARVRDAVLLVDERDRVIEANEAAVDLFGWQKALLCEKTLPELEVEVGGARPPERSGYYESIMRLADGRMVPVEIDELAVRIGSRELRQLIVRDTAARRNEGIAPRDRSWVDAFFDMPFIGMAITSPETRRWVRFNDRLCEILGFTRAELAAISWPEITHPEDLEKDLTEFERTLRGEIDGYRIGKRFVRKDGTVIHAEIDVRARRFPDGRVDYFVATVQDVSDRVRSEERIADYVHRLERSMRGTVDAVTRMVDLRDPYTAGHEVRVGELAAAIGRELRLDEFACQGLSIIGRLHDIGKITLPAEILSKPGRLSEMEMGMVRTHAEQGYQILEGIEFDWPVAEVVRQHHERMDGSGYPQGLAGCDILLEARIMAVADVVESMISHRPYRPAKGLDLALAEIAGGAGVRYDSEVVAACIRLFRERGFSFST